MHKRIYNAYKIHVRAERLNIEMFVERMKPLQRHYWDGFFPFIAFNENDLSGVGQRKLHVFYLWLKENEISQEIMCTLYVQAYE